MSTRQWEWMRHRRELGLCQDCGAFTGDMRLCPTCASTQLDRQRKRRHSRAWEPGRPGRPPSVSACDVTKHLRQLLKNREEAE
jgi:hypothetical protein